MTATAIQSALKKQMACVYCGKAFEIYLSNLKPGTRHCSIQCRKADRKSAFWKNVDKSPDCWLWIGPKVGRGYGKFRYNGKTQRAHRVVWELTNGAIPDGMFVCHRCDTPACVRPEHLFLGMPLDNVHDMTTKKRHAHGEIRKNAKLTEIEVRQIRTRYEPRKVTVKQLAKEYKVDPGLIHRIIHRKVWKHVED